MEKEIKKKSSNYLSIRDSRKIIRYNIKQMRFYEAQKRKKRDKSEFTTVMRDENNLIEIENLKTCFFTDTGTVMSVNGVSFEIPKNKIVGVVGESGCGKSVTSLSIMQLVQAPQGQVVDGQIRFNSDDLGYDEQGIKIAYDIAKMPTANEEVKAKQAERLEKARREAEKQAAEIELKKKEDARKQAMFEQSWGSFPKEKC